MAFIRQLLDKKGYDVWSTSPKASVFDVLQKMAEKNIGALVVLDGDELVGVVSERDYARKVILKGKASMKTPVREIMTEEVVTVTPQSSIDEALTIMTEKRFRHLPVIDNNKVIGVISIGDLVESIIENQEFLIRQLEKYISGTRM